MKRNLIILMLATAVLAAGCGSKKEAATVSTELAANSTAAQAPANTATEVVTEAETEESIPEAVPITNSELDELVNENDAIFSGEDLVDDAFDETVEYADDDFDDVPLWGDDTDSAPSVDTTPEAGQYAEYVTLADYKNLSIEAPDDATVDAGMTVNIDYSGKINGKEYDGGADAGFDLTVGTGSFEETFENQLIGHKKGDAFTVKVNYPADYFDTALAEKTVEFDVKINTLYTTTPDLVLNQVVETSDVLQYPKAMEDEWKEAYLAQFKMSAMDDSATEEDLLKLNGFTDETFTNFIRTSLKQDLVYRAIMDAEGITENSDAYKEATAAMMTIYGFTDLNEAASFGISETEIRLFTEAKVAENVLVQYEQK